MKFEFDIPNDFVIQFYYMQERTDQVSVNWPHGFRFVMLSSPVDAIAGFGLLLKLFGFVQSAKTVLKLTTSSRRFYFVCNSTEIVSWGWCMVGKNNHYMIEPTAMYIGPIETVESHRGKGLASQALKAAINHHVRLGNRRFYIDTHQNNFAAQKSFGHAGFGNPCGFYRR